MSMGFEWVRWLGCQSCARPRVGSDCVPGVPGTPSDGTSRNNRIRCGLEPVCRKKKR
jgi:hypothetical protein